MKQNEALLCGACGKYFARSKQRSGEALVCAVCKRERVDNVSEIMIAQTEFDDSKFYEWTPGMYDMIVSEIISVDNPFEDDKQQLQVTFSDESGDRFDTDGTTPANKRAWCNPVWNPKSKLWAWSESILGSPPKAGEGFRSSMLVGQRCRVVMNKATNQKGEPIIKITDVLGAAEVGAPAGSAPAKKAKPGLVAAIKGGADVPENTELVCMCGKPAFSYDDDGNAVCPKHGGTAD